MEGRGERGQLAGWRQSLWMVAPWLRFAVLRVEFTGCRDVQRGRTGSERRRRLVLDTRTPDAAEAVSCRSPTLQVSSIIRFYRLPIALAAMS